MARRIVLVDGHPDPDPARLGHALADAYAAGAAEAGREVRRIVVAGLDLPLLSSAGEYRDGRPPPAAAEAQAAIRWAEHLVLIYPLWLGDLPAATKALLEQVLRPDFVGGGRTALGMPKGGLGGRSARVVVTMGMPALAYRLWFGAHSLRSLERNVLGLVGFGPLRRTLIGAVEDAPPARRAGWLADLRALGREGL